ncbi:hypothetical protein M404DRAFT_34847 [Pisolithus tinctorius Marx 270]|uniref:Uncharacterized protein n=1 Tax=Pisolithus tinctorius Marx 270 TaxID=870435 RepID=A0A0C3NFS3_PISTI|nr:hypothetical protein M404DRAFT_34847 [Pisolithus tinctorius Marx 270]
MYCNLNKVIQVSRALEADDTASGTDDPDDETYMQCSYDHSNPEKCKRYKCIYDYLKEQAPYFMDLIKKKKSGETALLMHEMQQVISWMQSDDASHLKPMIAAYAAPHPDKKLVDPPVNVKGSKDRLGFNHAELTQLLCLVRSLQALLADATGVRKQLQNGSILVTVQKWPAFLYSGDIPGKDYNPEKSDEGFLCRYFIE